MYSFQVLDLDIVNKLVELKTKEASQGFQDEMHDGKIIKILSYPLIYALQSLQEESNKVNQYLRKIKYFKEICKIASNCRQEDHSNEIFFSCLHQR